jgi:hypothetical protein
MKPSMVLDANRQRIRDLTERHGLLNPRVFCSVARGDDRENSDIDILVDCREETSLLDLGGLQFDLEEALGWPVHLVSARGLKGRMRERVLREARAI